MRVRSGSCLLLVCLASCACIAQTPVTALCTLTSNAAAYSGKTVSVKAYVVVDYHGTFLADQRCKKMIPLVLPEGSDRLPRISLVEDEAYKHFDELVHDYRPGTTQPKGRVEAQFEGRFELLSQQSDSRLARWQLVLQRVSSVRVR